jgi:uncharacterized protein YciI
MAWFIKTKTFRTSPAEARPHLAPHLAWLAKLRARGIPIGDGLLLLEAANQAVAEALIRIVPIVHSGFPGWKPQG